MKITPLIYAAILFLIIRLANDLPIGSNYFQHSIGFIAIELTGIILGSYLYFYMANYWIRVCAGRHIGLVWEYIVVILFSVMLPLIVMGISHDVPLPDEIIHIIVPVVITLLMSLWVYLALKYNYISQLYLNLKIKEKEAQNARIKTELSLLRSQYHPHFLFNMLNFIYFSINEDNAEARNTVEHLADFMRIQLYDGDGPVAIEREIKAMESYIKLCQARYGDSVEVSTSIDTRYATMKIHPYLLLPLVENAFKHSKGVPRRINVSLKRTHESLDFRVDNTISEIQNCEIQKEESGIGLKNLRRRLELLYPDRYDLTVIKDSGLYSTHLYLTL